MQPSTEADLAEAIRAAPGPLRIIGGDTRPIGHTVDGAPLSTAALTGITLYEPGALTIVARAGTPLAEIEAALAAKGQRLPFEPMDHRGLLGTSGTPTIGGAVAANASGPRRVQAGACRDSLIGVRFVDGTGTVIKNGGRVMKNVTGYDLVKLMGGSWGTLGVLTEVSFKVLPAPDSQATLRIAGLEDAQAIAALASGLTSPFEVTGAAHRPGHGTFLRIEGFSASVAYRTEALSRRLAPFGPVDVIGPGAEAASLWDGIRDIADFHDAPGDVWRVHTRPSDAPALTGRAQAAGALRGVVYDWGGGLIWMRTDPGHDLRAALGACAGHATLVRASAAPRAHLPRFAPEPAPVAALTAGLRAKFDPRGILNPGLMS